MKGVKIKPGIEKKSKHDERDNIFDNFKYFIKILLKKNNVIRLEHNETDLMTIPT